MNNYSGSGTVTTADGYYHLGFPYDAALTEPEPEPTPEPAGESEEPQATPAPAEEEPAAQSMPAPLRGVLAGILILAGVWVIVVLVRAARRKQDKQ